MKFPSPSSNGAVISITDLSRSFGPKTVLDNISLYVPKGGVFGLVGENGAGKTTLIKHVLGLLGAESGTVRVFGLDPVKDPVGVLGRVGYLSEQPDLPGWMRVDEFMRYTAAFYPKWDAAYAEELRHSFQLPPQARIKSLSKGQRAKVGLLAAQAHRPDLLLLDEPSSGLDPLARRDILEAVIRTVADERRTVFFSTHFLDEIERVSDHIAMLDQGKLVLCGPLDEVKQSYRRIALHFHVSQTLTPAIPGALIVTGAGKEWSAVVKIQAETMPEIFASFGARIVGEQGPSLTEIFVAHATRQSSDRAASQTPAS
jgi:ABC-2 type transport system ATP-binding protein